MYSVTLVSFNILHIRLSAGVQLSHNNKWEEKTDPNPIFPFILVAYVVSRYGCYTLHSDGLPSSLF